MLCYNKGFKIFKVVVRAYRIRKQNCTILGGKICGVDVPLHAANCGNMQLCKQS